MPEVETKAKDNKSGVDSQQMVGEMKKLLKHSAVYGVGNILSKLIGMALMPVYTRYLSPQDYGIIELLNLTLNLITIIVGMGLSSAVLRFYFNTDSEKERNSIVSTAILFVSGFAITIVLITLYFDEELTLLLFKNKGLTVYFDLMIITFFFSGLIEIPLVLLRAQERSGTFTVVIILRLILALSLNIYFIVIAEWGVKGFLVSSLTTSVTISLILVITTLSRSPVTFSYKHLKTMVIFSLPLIPSALGMFWINFGDRFFLKQFYTDWHVGIYSLGYMFAMMISQLVGQPFFLIWSTRMYEIIRMKDGKRIYAKFCTYLAVIISFAGLGLSLTIPDVMKIVPSEQFYGAHVVVPIIALGYMFREISDFFRGALFIAKRTVYVGLTLFLTSIVCTLMYFILIPHFAMMGAAVSTLITFAFMAFTMLYFGQKVMPIPYEYRRLITAFLLAFGLYLVFHKIELANPWARLCLMTGISFLYVPLLYWLGFFSDREKEKIRDLINKTLNFIKAARRRT